MPGVDDGAPAAGDSLGALSRMVAAGYDRIVTTPHLKVSLTLDPPAFRARMDEVERAWDGVVERAASRWPELELRLGFEVRLDAADGDVTDDRLRLGGTGFVLVEWPRMRVPPGAAGALARLRLAGLRPVVAHPERYGGLDRALEEVAAWREAGAFLQVNNGSLVGRYGERARRRALRLLERGWVDYLSTDFHGRAHLSLYTDEARGRVWELGGGEQWQLLSRTNPGRLFENEEPLPVPPLAGAADGLRNEGADRSHRRAN